MKNIAPHVASTVIDELNESHRNARLSAEDAVKLAIRCGELLQEVKRKLPHGQFLPWVAQHCEFSERTARLYMQAAETKSAGLDFSSIKKLYGEKSETSNSNRQPLPISTESKSAPAHSTPTRDRPAPAGSPPVQSSPAGSAQELLPADDPERPGADEEEAIGVAAQAELDDYLQRLFASDDKLATAHIEIERQAREIATLKSTRNHFQNQAGELGRLIKSRDRAIDKLEGQLKDAQAQIRQLRQELAA